jgi:hypothetical protein
MEALVLDLELQRVGEHGGVVLRAGGGVHGIAVGDERAERERF